MLSQLRGMFNAGGQIDQVVQSKLDRLEKLVGTWDDEWTMTMPGSY